MRRQLGQVAMAIALLLTHLAPAQAAEETLNIYVGRGQMPFADGQHSREGMVRELMDHFCLELNLQCHYTEVPWRRSAVELSNDPQGVVLNFARIPERDQDFHWLLPVLGVAYVLVSTEGVYHSLEQALEAGPVVVMGGTPRALQAHALKQEGQVVIEVTDPVQAARILHSGRAVAWYEIDLRADYLWRSLDLTDQPLKRGNPLLVADSYIAASPQMQSAKELSARMRKVFAQMRYDGRWQDILRRYLGTEKALHYGER